MTYALIRAFFLILVSFFAQIRTDFISFTRYQEGQDFISYNRELTPYGPMWVKEAKRKFLTDRDPSNDNFLVVLCHGAGFTIWVAVPDDPYPIRPVEVLIREIQHNPKYHNRHLLLIICNESGFSLPPDIENVTYAKNIVWAAPDRDLHLRGRLFPDYVGNIFEFTNTESD